MSYEFMLPRSHFEVAAPIKDQSWYGKDSFCWKFSFVWSTWPLFVSGDVLFSHWIDHHLLGRLCNFRRLKQIQDSVKAGEFEISPYLGWNEIELSHHGFWRVLFEWPMCRHSGSWPVYALVAQGFPHPTTTRCCTHEMKREEGTVLHVEQRKRTSQPRAWWPGGELAAPTAQDESEVR